MTQQELQKMLADTIELLTRVSRVTLELYRSYRIAPGFEREKRQESDAISRMIETLSANIPKLRGIQHSDLLVPFQYLAFQHTCAYDLVCECKVESHGWHRGCFYFTVCTSFGEVQNDDPMVASDVPSITIDDFLARRR